MSDTRESSDRCSNVLCVRLDGMGDVLMTSPAFRALGESHPARRITVLTSSAGGTITPLLPGVDETIVYDAPWMKATPPRADAADDARMIARLRDHDFDAAVIFTTHTQSPLPAALMCFLAGIPARLAYCRENPYQLLTDWVGEPDAGAPSRHEVERHLDLVRTAGAVTADDRIVMEIPERARRSARAALHAVPVDTFRPWALLHPGATAPSRRYPPEHFARVASALAVHGVTPVFTGAASELPLVDEIRAMSAGGSVSLAGRLDVPSLAALIDAAPALITNNTGPAHIAAATGTPVVVLYALTNLQHQPWRARSRVLSYDVPCHGCYRSVCPEGHHLCLRGVAPESVVDATLELLRESAPASRVGAMR
jgi:lipopolysaccharide heptosyltransferase II